MGWTEGERNHFLHRLKTQVNFCQNKLEKEKKKSAETVKSSLHGATVPLGICNLIYISFKKEGGGKRADGR